MEPQLGTPIGKERFSTKMPTKNNTVCLFPEGVKKPPSILDPTTSKNRGKSKPPILNDLPPELMLIPKLVTTSNLD